MQAKNRMMQAIIIHATILLGFFGGTSPGMRCERSRPDWLPLTPPMRPELTDAPVAEEAPAVRAEAAFATGCEPSLATALASPDLFALIAFEDWDVLAFTAGALPLLAASMLL